jgi:RimJ/RimL family protein N-acetyltransferase
MPGPVFADGEKVELRTIEDEDVEFLQKLVNHPRVRHGLGSSDPVTRSEEAEWVDSLSEAEGYHFLIADAGTPVGTVGLNDVNESWGVAEAGYFVHPDHWDNGYATAAMRTICAFAFEEKRLNKVVARAYETNPASRRVLEKTGFTEEGCLRNEAFVEGEHVDVHRYGLLAEEW